MAGPGFRQLFPAVVADASVHSDMIGLLVLAGRRYLVGEPAQTDPSHRYATKMDKVSTDDELARYCAALALLADQYDTRTLSVCTGLPPSHWRDDALRQLLQQRLTGEFAFTYEGRPYSISVPNLVVDPQAGAAFYDYLLHDDGEIARPELLNRQTVVLDVGHNTTDVALFNGRKAAGGRDSLKTVNRGVWHVYEEMQRLLLREYRLPVSVTTVDGIWRAGKVRLNGQMIDVSPLKLEAAAPIARAILSDVERAAGDLRLWDGVLLTGGGAHVLGSTLKLTNISVLTSRDAEYGNSAGYVKRQIERARAAV